MKLCYKNKFNFTIGKKIGGEFDVLILCPLIVFIVTTITLNTSIKSNDYVMNMPYPSVATLEDLNLLIVRSKMLIHILGQDTKWYR